MGAWDSTSCLLEIVVRMKRFLFGGRRSRMICCSSDRLVSQGSGSASVEGRPDPAKEVRRMLMVE